MPAKRPHSEVNGSTKTTTNGPSEASRPQKRRLLERFQNNRELPLNLILMVTAHLDDVADLARITRTSRLLYYMCLPRLWENVTLRTYSELRYKNGRLEGYGGGSPFSMAVDALVSRGFATYVKTFKIVGEWREVDVEEFSKGRVPDNTMMLNIALKAALDKMDKLQSFSWELNTKPLKMIYQSLASKTTLRSLTLKCPSCRIPRPTVTILPIPSLKSLHIYDIDPLCYPDDLSLLLAKAPQLKELKLEWSPRMRREGEPSVTLATYYGRAASAGVKIPLKSLTYKNLYARNERDSPIIFDASKLESLTFLNCMNPGNPSTAFYDNTWRGVSTELATLTNLRKLRIDNADDDLAQMLAELSSLEEFYLSNQNAKLLEFASELVNGSSPPVQEPNCSRKPHESTPVTPTTTNNTTPLIRCPASETLAALSTHHGHRLKVVLLSNQWKLSKDAIVSFTKACPLLQQLAVAIDGPQFETARAFLPNLPHIWALRILEDDGMLELTIERASAMGGVHDRLKREVIGKELAKPEYRTIRYFSLSVLAFELGRVVEVKSGTATIQRRVVKSLSWEEAKAKAEIFGLDSLDI